MKECRLAHGLEHVEVVVACGTVGAEANGNAGGAHRRYRRHPTGQLHVALGIVRNADVPARQDLNLGRRQVDPMCRNRPRPPEAQRLEVLRGRGVILLVRRGNFIPGFREMDDDRNVQPVGQRTARLQRRAVEGVHRVRRNGRRNQLVVFELVDEFLGTRDAFGGCLCVGDGELNDRLAQDPTQSCGLRRARDLLLEVVHVDVRRRPRLDHFEGRETRARADELWRHRLRFGREDVVLQPVHERQIVREPAEHHHRRVRVRVDQPWHDHGARGVDRIAPRVPRCDGIARIHRDDVAAVDRHRALLDHAVRPIDRDYDSVRDDERDVAPARWLCGTKRNGAHDDWEETPHI